MFLNRLLNLSTVVFLLTLTGCGGDDVLPEPVESPTLISTALPVSLPTSTPVVTPTPLATSTSQPTPLVISSIAHAGGGIDGQTYSNSWQAIELALENGFIYLEIDFEWTTDGHIVCLHDWSSWIYETYISDTEPGPISYQRFQELDELNTQFDYCDLPSLALWLESHPDIYIVTDVKTRSSEAFVRFSETLTNLDQFIIQIYQPEQYAEIKGLGFDNIIWTLYKYAGNQDDVLGWTESMTLFAVTMPQSRAREGLGLALLEENIPTYVHTINSLESKQTFIDDFGITDIYTDFLFPGQ